MQRVISEKHQWVAATTIDVTDDLARRGMKRGTMRVPAETKVEVLDVYCAICKRPYDAVADQKCSAAKNTEHLRGGPIGERAKRKHPQHDCMKAGCTIGQSAVAATAAAV